MIINRSFSNQAVNSPFQADTAPPYILGSFSSNTPDSLVSFEGFVAGTIGVFAPTLGLVSSANDPSSFFTSGVLNKTLDNSSASFNNEQKISGTFDSQIPQQLVRMLVAVGTQVVGRLKVTLQDNTTGNTSTITLSGTGAFNQTNTSSNNTSKITNTGTSSSTLNSTSSSNASSETKIVGSFSGNLQNSSSASPDATSTYLGTFTSTLGNTVSITFESHHIGVLPVNDTKEFPLILSGALSDNLMEIYNEVVAGRDFGVNLDSESQRVNRLLGRGEFSVTFEDGNEITANTFYDFLFIFIREVFLGRRLPGSTDVERQMHLNRSLPKTFNPNWRLPVSVT